MNSLPKMIRGGAVLLFLSFCLVGIWNNIPAQAADLVQIEEPVSDDLVPGSDHDRWSVEEKRKNKWSLFSGFKLHDWRQPCSGDCAVHFYAGKFVDTSMASIFSLSENYQFDPSVFVPVWKWDYEESYLLAAATSRRLISYKDMLDIEGEAGIAQRMGLMNGTEFWGALYLRWKKFPWNHRLYTTIGVSTGISYATKLEPLETKRAGAGNSGSRLLHFLSPEITFARPEEPNKELVLRFHHRSGAADIFESLSNNLFNGVNGGAQHATIGFRYRF